VKNPNPNLDFQPKTLPLVGYPKVIPYTKFEHFGIICFFSYALTTGEKCTGCCDAALTLTFDLSTPNPCHF